MDSINHSVEHLAVETCARVNLSTYKLTAEVPDESVIELRKKSAEEGCFVIDASCRSAYGRDQIPRLFFCFFACFAPLGEAG